MPRPIRLGVITSEFFDIRLGPMGGFGWAPKQLGQIFREDLSLGVSRSISPDSHRRRPLKRPWIFAELAWRSPRVEFLFLGQSHFRGPGAWSPAGLSPNIQLLGHVDEADKSRLLSAAWAVLNTSIHEGLAISFLEALACEAPLLSCQDPGFVVSRFGIYTGRFDGSGMEGLDAFTQSLETLLDDNDQRSHLGRSGRAWVESTHTREGVVEAFRRLCEHAGLGR